MSMIELILLCLLATLVITTFLGWRAGNERRDVGLLAGLTALCGVGAATALVV
ncbi:hypothetical protein AVME950_21270 [Acidovorax sp. SUPP950]|uniref:hypothetical protein n=1 Tax=unclassified Acidovorax TaxID=2684926 RepID=UPI0023D052F6|nr:MULTISPECIES: hypothetical protein [Comamonadaceae]WOI45277.1 hypothetical protein R1Z03_22615 [Paracidovorax avenae]GKS77472.1 hypothetical protein AVME950_21270 [Acidovorax sp. SUPP950]